jgi:ubiquinone/menaquinone biosynthesis C-methylase UbiE
MLPSKSTRFREFYQQEATHYHSRRYATRYGSLFRHLHHHVLRELLGELTPSSTVLEVACGTGHTTELLTSIGLSPIASDLTVQMMQQARERAAGVAFVRADAFRLPFRDNSFDAVVSTRFFHLFPLAEQRRLAQEMHRVLKPSGRLVVDFDNFTSRWLLALPYFLYNLMRYRRAAPYAVYNRIKPSERMLRDVGFQTLRSHGIGGTHLILPALASPAWAFRLGLLHRATPLRALAEQFIISGLKTP